VKRKEDGKMAIGYACMVIGEPDTTISSCILKSATPAKLAEISMKNLLALERMVDYNVFNQINLFRISSDIIPFASHPVNQLDWTNLFKEQLDRIGEKIKQSGIRVSSHPGQYTVLNSPIETVVGNAIEDLIYHGDFMDALNLDSSHKIILHIGGIYGKKPEAIDRFLANYKNLPQNIKNRLVIENDDRSYNIEDVLGISKKIAIPVVFDNLHHKVNPPDLTDTIKSEKDWIIECSKTWKPKDGNPKIHYSQSKSKQTPRAHSGTINLREFYIFYQTISEYHIDIMLEVKDKNLSALKCIYATSPNLPLKRLEDEWARYKYYVLGQSATIYLAISGLFNENNLEKNSKEKKTIEKNSIEKNTMEKNVMAKDLEKFPDNRREGHGSYLNINTNTHEMILNTNSNSNELIFRFYELIDTALLLPEEKGAQKNAAQHVWGYMKNTCTMKEKLHFLKLLLDYDNGKKSISAVKNFLFRETIKQQIPYLTRSHYFYI